MAELTKEEKKAMRKEKIKKIAKYVIPCITTAAFTGFEAYLIGKHNGRNEVLNGPELKLIKGMAAYDAIDRYKETQLSILMSETDDGQPASFATRFTNDNTGEVKYVVSTLSDTQPDWWEEKNTIDLGEKIADNIAEGK